MSALPTSLEEAESMKYDISLLGVYLSSKDVSSWSRSLWRFDSTDHALVIGLPEDRRGSGSAMVFGRSGGSWGGQASLSASDGKAGDGFGFQVAMDEDIAVVTAPFAAGRAGAAYVYRWNGRTWIEEQKLMATASNAFALFGSSVDVGGGIVAVGATSHGSGGSVHIFRRSASSWNHEQTLLPDDDRAEDEFAYALSLEDDELVVGAPSAGAGRGAAHVFAMRHGAWTEAQRLDPLEGDGNDFGRHVAHALGPPVLIIGGSRSSTTKRVGSVAHLFQRDDEAWEPFGVLTQTESR